MNMGEDFKEKIKIEEYKCLREEHQKNRGHIFERPLLIISIVALATQFLIQYSGLHSSYGQDSLALLASLATFPILIAILYFNLSFIAERLKSDARLVAYIQLFHEDKFANRWTGWETSLRRYRIWMNSKNNNELEIQKKMEKSAIFHVGWFYPKIYYFHVFFVIVILLIWFLVIHRLLVAYSDNINVITFIVMLIVSLYLLHHYFIPLRSSQLEDRIERERAIWLLVYNE
jgi:hypothetical protein